MAQSPPRAARSSSSRSETKINELGIQYIYYQFVSVDRPHRRQGRAGRSLGGDRRRRAFSWSTARPRISSSIATSNYIGYGPEASELVGIPDPETFVQLPWDKRVARVFCTCFRNREEQAIRGGHLTSDCRGNLRIIHEQFQKNHKGLHLRHGCEPEMMWLKKGADGLRRRRLHKPNCYHIDQFESLRPVFLRVIEYAPAMGLDMIQGDHEDAPGQLELNFMFDDCLRTADRLTTYRQICAQVAREFDLIACFMAKPFMGVSANGCHHNLSLWRGGEDESTRSSNEQLPGWSDIFTYRKGGENTFHAAARAQIKPGPIGLNCIGGMIKHLRRADRDRLARRSTPIAASGIPASGRRSTPIGAIRTAPARCASRRRAASNTARSIRR